MMRFFRLASGFWRGPLKRRAWLLSLAFLACLFLAMGLQVAVTRWNKYFFDALQAKDMHVILLSIGAALTLALGTSIVNVALIQSRMRLQLRWRQWMTRAYVARWLDNATHYRMQRLGDAADNPDQRLTDDVKMFVERTLTLARRVLGRDRNCVRLASETQVAQVSHA